MGTVRLISSTRKATQTDQLCYAFTEPARNQPCSRNLLQSVRKVHCLIQTMASDHSVVFI